MGQASTANALQHNSALAQTFIAWLAKLLIITLAFKAHLFQHLLPAKAMSNCIYAQLMPHLVIKRIEDESNTFITAVWVINLVLESPPLA